MTTSWAAGLERMAEDAAEEVIRVGEMCSLALGKWGGFLGRVEVDAFNATVS